MPNETSPRCYALPRLLLNREAIAKPNGAQSKLWQALKKPGRPVSADRLRPFNPDVRKVRGETRATNPSLIGFDPYA
jgi:hypothetical protein